LISTASIPVVSSGTLIMREVTKYESCNDSEAKHDRISFVGCTTQAIASTFYNEEGKMMNFDFTGNKVRGDESTVKDYSFTGNRQPGKKYDHTGKPISRNDDSWRYSSWNFEYLEGESKTSKSLEVVVDKTYDITYDVSCRGNFINKGLFTFDEFVMKQPDQKDQNDGPKYFEMRDWLSMASEEEVMRFLRSYIVNGIDVTIDFIYFDDPLFKKWFEDLFWKTVIKKIAEDVRNPEFLYSQEEDFMLTTSILERVVKLTKLCNVKCIGWMSRLLEVMGDVWEQKTDENHSAVLMNEMKRMLKKEQMIYKNNIQNFFDEFDWDHNVN